MPSLYELTALFRNHCPAILEAPTRPMDICGGAELRTETETLHGV